MTEILTGKQLRDRAEACLDQRRPDKETLRSWIRRGADRIDKLTTEVQRLEASLESGGSDAALMMLEDARVAADSTLARVKEMEAEAEAALDTAKAAAGKEVHEVLTKAQADAAVIIAEGREKAAAHMAETDAECQQRLERAIDHAEKVDKGCHQLVEDARQLEQTYRDRVAGIRGEAEAMIDLLDRLDSMAISKPDEFQNDEVIDELFAEIVELNAVGQARDDTDADEGEIEEVG